MPKVFTFQAGSSDSEGIQDQILIHNDDDEVKRTLFMTQKHPLHRDHLNCDCRCRSYRGRSRANNVIMNDFKDLRTQKSTLDDTFMYSNIVCFINSDIYVVSDDAVVFYYLKCLVKLLKYCKM